MTAVENSENLTGEEAAYFDVMPCMVPVYERLRAELRSRFDAVEFKVGKSQITLKNRHVFGAVSIPVRRKKEWPRECLLVTFGLARRVDNPRIAVSVEPYPNRWTHHVVVASPEDIDAQLLEWLREAYDFAASKR